MRPDLIENLRVKFPEVFSLANDPKNAVEINCDDGWFAIIEDMSAQFSELSDVPQITFIKEKFGELRVFFTKGDSEASLISAFAETQSLQTCEICGDYGARIDSDGVFKTVCAKHRNFREERRKLRGY